MNNVTKQTVASNLPPKDGGLTISVAPRAKKQLIGMTLATLLGIAAALFILANIYQGIFIIKSPNAMVGAPMIDIRANAAGVFSGQIGPETATVEPGQAIGTITQQVGPTQNAMITSPCDCVIADTHAYNGQYVTAGDKIMTLVPSDAKPWILAEVEPDKAMRLNTETAATVLIAGSQINYTGKIVGLKSALSQPGGGSDADYLPRPAMVKIMLDQTVPADFTGRPAKVIFSTR